MQENFICLNLDLVKLYALEHGFETHVVLTPLVNHFTWYKYSSIFHYMGDSVTT